MPHKFAQQLPGKNHAGKSSISAKKRKFAPQSGSAEPLQKPENGRLHSALCKISEAAHSSESLEKLYDSIHGIVKGLMPAGNFYIALLNKEETMIHFPYFVDAEESNPGCLELGRGLTEFVLRTGQPLLASPEVFDKLVKQGEIESVGPPSIDWLGVPLKARNRTLGILAVQSYTEGVRYSEEDKAILTFISEQIAMAIERKMALDAHQQSEELYRSLIRTSPDAVTATDLEGKITFVSERTLEIHGFENPHELVGRNTIELIAPQDHKRAYEDLKKTLRFGSISNEEYRLLRKDGTCFYGEMSASLVTNGSGKPRAFIAITRDISERKKAEQVLRESEEKYRTIVENSLQGIIIVQDFRIVFANEAFCKIYGYSLEELLAMRPEKLKSLVYTEDQATIWGRLMDRLTGKNVPSLYEFRGMRKDGSLCWLEMSSSLVEHEGKPAAQGIIIDITDKKFADDERRQNFEKLRLTLEGTVKALSSAFELRDPYTAGHQQRVTELACTIAKALNLHQNMIEGLRLAGQIHDIGKIQVPSEILGKPGRLTSIEFGMIKLHPQAGHEILKAVEFPYPVAQIILQHHERLDGSGYPQGLKGRKILMEARILAVADVVEAMASYRPYRPPLGIGRALDEITKNKGSFYDREVVDACLHLFSQKTFRLPSTENYAEDGFHPTSLD